MTDITKVDEFIEQLFLAKNDITKGVTITPEKLDHHFDALSHHASAIVHYRNQPETPAYMDAAHEHAAKFVDERAKALKMDDPTNEEHKAWRRKAYGSCFARCLHPAAELDKKQQGEFLSEINIKNSDGTTTVAPKFKPLSPPLAVQNLYRHGYAFSSQMNLLKNKEKDGGVVDTKGHALSITGDEVSSSHSHHALGGKQNEPKPNSWKTAAQYNPGVPEMHTAKELLSVDPGNSENGETPEYNPRPKKDFDFTKIRVNGVPLKLRNIEQMKEEGRTEEVDGDNGKISIPHVDLPVDYAPAVSLPTHVGGYGMTAGHSHSNKKAFKDFDDRSNNAYMLPRENIHHIHEDESTSPQAESPQSGDTSAEAKPAPVPPKKADPFAVASAHFGAHENAGGSFDDLFAEIADKPSTPIAIEPKLPKVRRKVDSPSTEATPSPVSPPKKEAAPPPKGEYDESDIDNILQSLKEDNKPKVRNLSPDEVAEINRKNRQKQKEIERLQTEEPQAKPAGEEAKAPNPEPKKELSHEELKALPFLQFSGDEVVGFNPKKVDLKNPNHKMGYMWYKKNHMDKSEYFGEIPLAYSILAKNLIVKHNPYKDCFGLELANIIEKTLNGDSMAEKALLFAHLEELSKTTIPKSNTEVAPEIKPSVSSENKISMADVIAKNPQMFQQKTTSLAIGQKHEDDKAADSLKRLSESGIDPHKAGIHQLETPQQREDFIDFHHHNMVKDVHKIASSALAGAFRPHAQEAMGHLGDLEDRLDDMRDKSMETNFKKMGNIISPEESVKLRDKIDGHFRRAKSVASYARNAIHKMTSSGNSEVNEADADGNTVPMSLEEISGEKKRDRTKHYLVIPDKASADKKALFDDHQSGKIDDNKLIEGIHNIATEHGMEPKHILYGGSRNNLNNTKLGTFRGSYESLSPEEKELAIQPAHLPTTSYAKRIAHIYENQQKMIENKEITEQQAESASLDYSKLLEQTGTKTKEDMLKKLVRTPMKGEDGKLHAMYGDYPASIDGALSVGQHQQEIMHANRQGTGLQGKQVSSMSTARKLNRESPMNPISNAKSAVDSEPYGGSRSADEFRTIIHHVLNGGKIDKQEMEESIKEHEEAIDKMTKDGTLYSEKGRKIQSDYKNMSQKLPHADNINTIHNTLPDRINEPKKFYKELSSLVANEFLKHKADASIPNKDKIHPERDVSSLLDQINSHAKYSRTNFKNLPEWAQKLNQGYGLGLDKLKHSGTPVGADTEAYLFNKDKALNQGIDVATSVPIDEHKNIIDNEYKNHFDNVNQIIQKKKKGEPIGDKEQQDIKKRANSIYSDLMTRPMDDWEPDYLEEGRYKDTLGLKDDKKPNSKKGIMGVIERKRGELQASGGGDYDAAADELSEALSEESPLSSPSLGQKDYHAAHSIIHSPEHLKSLLTMPNEDFDDYHQSLSAGDHDRQNEEKDATQSMDVESITGDQTKDNKDNGVSAKGINASVDQANVPFSERMKEDWPMHGGQSTKRKLTNRFVDLLQEKDANGKLSHPKDPLTRRIASILYNKANEQNVDENKTGEAGEFRKLVEALKLARIEHGNEEGSTEKVLASLPEHHANVENMLKLGINQRHPSNPVFKELVKPATESLTHQYFKQQDEAGVRAAFDVLEHLSGGDSEARGDDYNLNSHKDVIEAVKGIGDRKTREAAIASLIAKKQASGTKKQ
jgi:hypothetical protein